MKSWTIIKTSQEYKSAAKRIEELSQNPPSPASEEGRELLLLGYLVNQYEEGKFIIEHPDPIEAIQVRMSELNLAVSDLLAAFGDKGTASKVLRKERALSLNMIRELSARLSLPAELLIQPIRPMFKSRDISPARISLREPASVYKKRKSRRKS